MSLTEAQVEIANQAVVRIGAKTFTYAIQTSNEAVKCNLLFEPTRKSLLRSFEWNFASARAALTAEITGPDFEYTYRYKLPSDFLRLFKKKGLYSEYPRKIEGDYLLTDDDAAQIKYVRNITDPAKFDPLFTEVFVLTLAKKMIPPLAGTKSNPLQESVLMDLREAMFRAKAVCRSENDETIDTTWNSSRYGTGII